jgi:GDP-D-mannose dehydratase
MGNLAAKRDWGFAGDYVRAMRLILHAECPREDVVPRVDPFQSGTSVAWPSTT